MKINADGYPELDDPAEQDYPPEEQEYPCPQCARFKEKLDREKMAKVLEDNIINDSPVRINLKRMADALIAYLTE